MSSKTLSADLKWLKDMQFEAQSQDIKDNQARDHKLIIDATPEHGGHNLGPTPKDLVLHAMMGCTSMDVIAILNKMRQPFTDFKMSAEAKMTESHPIHFAEVKLTYYFTGELDTAKVIKAVTSSMSKYCGVNYMISKACPINLEILINDSSIHTANVNFI
jgi:putative redox protein